MASVAREGLVNKGGEDEGLAAAQQTGGHRPCRDSTKQWGGREVAQSECGEDASFNFMAAVTICSDFGAQKNKV